MLPDCLELQFIRPSAYLGRLLSRLVLHPGMEFGQVHRWKYEECERATMTLATDILLIEDEPGVMDVMLRVLQRAGFGVRTAQDGAAALAALHECPPALAILDLVLPGISGLAVLTHIHQQYPTLPVIVITANPQAIAHPAAQSVRHYLLKPFHIEELLDMVARAGMRS
jgi:DNA-binding NtrC family response regulator